MLNETRIELPTDTSTLVESIKKKDKVLKYRNFILTINNPKLEDTLESYFNEKSMSYLVGQYEIGESGT